MDYALKCQNMNANGNCVVNSLIIRLHNPKIMKDESASATIPFIRKRLGIMQSL